MSASGLVDDVMFSYNGANWPESFFVQFARWRHQSDVRQRCLTLVEFAMWRNPGAKSAVSDYTSCFQTESHVERLTI